MMECIVWKCSEYGTIKGYFESNSSLQNIFSVMNYITEMCDKYPNQYIHFDVQYNCKTNKYRYPLFELNHTRFHKSHYMVLHDKCVWSSIRSRYHYTSDVYNDLDTLHEMICEHAKTIEIMRLI